MNYELLLELLKQPLGARGIDTPAEMTERQGAINAFRGQAVPNMMQLASRGSRGIDTPAEQYMRIGAMGNQNATQNILKAFLGQ